MSIVSNLNKAYAKLYTFLGQLVDETTADESEISVSRMPVLNVLKHYHAFLIKLFIGCINEIKNDKIVSNCV